jgi:HEAT repeats
MIEQEKKQQIRQKVGFLVMLTVGCLGAGGFAVSRGMSTYQNNEKFVQVDAEEKFSRLPQYLRNDLALLKDADPHVPYQAAEALGGLQAQEAIPQLTLSLKGSDQYARYFAAEASGKLQAQEAIPQLTLSLKNLDSDVRFSVTLALSKLQEQETIPQLTLLLKCSDQYVRYFAAEESGKLQSKESLKDADLDVIFGKIHAFGALRELPAKEAILQLMLWLKDADSDVRSSAVKSLSTSYVKNHQNHNSDRVSGVIVIRQNLYQELTLLGGSSLVILVLLLLYFQQVTLQNLVRELILLSSSFVTLVLLLLKLLHSQQVKGITFYLKCYFPEDIIEDVVANLAVLRERLTKEEKSPLLIQFILFCQILTLAWGICIEMNIDNITLPSRDQRIDK